MNNNPPLICPEDGGKIIERKGTSKEGKSYHFFGCSNFPDCRFTWRPEKQSSPITVIPETPKTEEDKIDIIIKALREIYDLLNKRLPK